MALSTIPHRFTVDEYRRLGETGFFAPDVRTELVDGILFERVGVVKPPHAACVADLFRRLAVAIGDRAELRCGLPITLGDFSEPEPDIAVVNAPSSAYWERHPAARDVTLLIEVAESSRHFDRTRKVPLYAAYGIKEVWLIDLVDRCAFVFREPVEREYASEIIVRSGDDLAPLAYPDIRIALDDVLGPPTA